VRWMGVKEMAMLDLLVWSVENVPLFRVVGGRNGVHYLQVAAFARKYYT
jgi:hypothetical protein